MRVVEYTRGWRALNRVLLSIGQVLCACQNQPGDLSLIAKLLRSVISTLAECLQV